MAKTKLRRYGDQQSPSMRSLIYGGVAGLLFLGFIMWKRISMPELPLEGNATIPYETLWPYIKKYGSEYGIDPQIIAGVVAQESSWINYIVHPDGTGHGLIGLDDNGLLPDFEKWGQVSIGRGAGAAVINPEMQIEYLARKLGEYANKYGDVWTAVRIWHRGIVNRDDEKGYSYQSAISGRIEHLPVV